MRNHSRFPKVLCYALLCLLALVHCNQGRAVIRVSLGNLLDTVTTLRINANLDARVLDQTMPTISPPGDLFELRLDSGAVGVLRLEVTAIDSSGCQIGAGSGEVEISADGLYNLSIALSYEAAFQGCKAVINKVGDGDGTIEGGAGNVLCDLSVSSTVQQCELKSMLGAQFLLRATPGERSFFAGWTEHCKGTGECKIEIMEQAISVSATFLPNFYCIAQSPPSKICWEQPLPQGNHLNAIFGLASDDIWMAGDLGTLLHWNGTYVATVTSTTSAALHGLWGSSSSDVWAVGDRGTILHWNGKTWSAVSSGTTEQLRGLWGYDAKNVWVVGQNGTLLKWDGQAFTTATLPSAAAGLTLRASWGQAPNDIWVVGDAGTILKWNGSVWVGQGSGTGEGLNAVFGIDGRHIWAVGDSGTIRYFDGTSWTAQQSPAGASVHLTSVWGNSVGDVWAAGQQATLLRLSPTMRWSIAESGQPFTLTALWGSGSSDIWAVGEGGTILHNSGRYFQAITKTQVATPLRAVLGIASNNVWAVGDRGAVLRNTGSNWVFLPGMQSLLADLMAVSSRGTSEVWMAGASGTVLSWDGAQLQTKSDPSLMGTPKNHIYSILPLDSAEGVFTAGDGGMIHRYDSASSLWTTLSGPGLETYNGIWGLAATDLWAIGNGGVIRRSQGGGFMPDPQSGIFTTQNLRAIWGSAANRIWIVGDAGTILYYDGSGWSLVNSGQTANLYGIWGSAETNIWIVGAMGTILHSEGQGFTPLSTVVTTHDLYGVGGDLRGDVWFVGAHGAILRRRND